MQNVFYEVKSFFRDIFAVIEYELLKVIRAPSELVVRSVQPILWLAIFGEVFARTHLLNDDSSSYLAFLAPGVLAQGTLFVAIFYGIAIIWERDMGILQKMLVTPAPRATIVFGKAFVAGVRSLTQGIVVYSFALLLKIPLTITPTHLGGVIIFIFF